MALYTQAEFIPKLPLHRLRIVSLVPSITELLYTLALTSNVVGITQFCPENKHHSATPIGGTKTVAIQKIEALSPDIIIANKEENTETDILQLAENHQVWLTDIKTLDDAQKLIQHSGALFNRVPEAAYLNHLITQGFNDLKTLKQNLSTQTFLYFIWKSPDMVAGNDTFIHHLITEFLPLENACKHPRYPALEHLTLSSTPNWIFLSSEPYPFSEKHYKTYQDKFPNSKIKCVDGTYFSWYGSRLIDTIHYFHEILKMMH